MKVSQVRALQLRQKYKCHLVDLLMYNVLHIGTAWHVTMELAVLLHQPHGTLLRQRNGADGDFSFLVLFM